MNSSSFHRKIYLLGSGFNNMESLLVQDNRASQLIYFDKLDTAKKCFDSFYENLLAPSFTPSIPPSDAEMKYLHDFMRLMAFGPVILEISITSYLSEIMKYHNKGLPLFKTPEGFFSPNTECWHLPMKPGFIQKFSKLDIAKDIETIPFIGPDGKMVIRVNKVSYSDEREALRPATKEEIEKILRDRGYL